MKVLLVNGSSHKNGETTTTLAIMEKILWEHKIETFWFQIGKEPVRGCID